MTIIFFGVGRGGGVKHVYCAKFMLTVFHRQNSQKTLNYVFNQNGNMKKNQKGSQRSLYLP